MSPVLIARASSPSSPYSAMTLSGNQMSLPRNPGSLVALKRTSLSRDLEFIGAHLCNVGADAISMDFPFIGSAIAVLPSVLETDVYGTSSMQEGLHDRLALLTLGVDGPDLGHRWHDLLTEE